MFKKDKPLNGQQIAQAQRVSNPAPATARQQMNVIRNGSVNDAVNFAMEDFYKAAVVMKRATDNYQTPHAELPEGMRSFVTQQFFRMNAAGLIFDALGFQAITEVMAELHKEAVNYIQISMAGWNKTIEAEGLVQKMFEQIAAEEAAQDSPPGSMH